MSRKERLDRLAALLLIGFLGGAVGYGFRAAMEEESLQPAVMQQEVSKPDAPEVLRSLPTNAEIFRNVLEICYLEYGFDTVESEEQRSAIVRRMKERTLDHYREVQAFEVYLRREGAFVTTVSPLPVLKDQACGTVFG